MELKSELEQAMQQTKADSYYKMEEMQNQFKSMLDKQKKDLTNTIKKTGGKKSGGGSTNFNNNFS